MPANRASPTFAAFVEPAGVYLIEYRRDRDGITVVKRQSDNRRILGLAEAGERVATLIKGSGAAQSKLAAAVRGFGSTYQIMMLPPAEPAVLGAVVRRELARINPEMEAPRVDYVLGGQIDRRLRTRPEGGTPQREVLVGAAPELALSAFAEEVALGGAELTHLTVLPQVLQRLYERADASTVPTACYVDLPGGPIIAFFHEAQLRLVVEPPISGDDDIPARVQTLAEHLDRGNLFLRQQFRGVELNRLLICVDQNESSDLISALRDRLHFPVENFPGPVSEPSALICLGAILDGEAEKGLNLSPFAESAEDKTARQRRTSVTIAASIVAAAAILWAIFSVASTLRLSAKVENNRKIAVERMSTLAPLRVVAAERQKNAQSLAYLEAVRANESQVQDVLRALVRATPPGIQLTNLTIDRSGTEWSASLAGTAFGDSGADVLLAIDRLFHAIPREMTVHDLLLTELSDLPTDQFGAGMKFSMTFVVSPQPKASP